MDLLAGEGDAMERPTRQIPPLFQDLQDVENDEAPRGERNVLEEVPDRLTPLEKQTYEVAEELRILIIITCCFAGLTTWVFPVLPDTVDVGGFALWWLGGVITTVMEWVAGLWVVAVVLGGISFFLALYLVVASHWLTRATKTEQLLMYGSVVLSVPNLLALLSIVVLWTVVVVLWGLIVFLILAIIGLCIQLFSPGR
jgi:hypothetical protein